MIQALLLSLALVGPQEATNIPNVKPLFATEAVGTDADDPAFWVDRKDPRRSLILGTDKTKAPNGALVVFNLKGKTVQRIAGIDRPNNVDVVDGFSTPEGRVSLAVLTERYKKRLRVFRCPVGSSRELVDISGVTDVFAGESGEDAEPMGIALGSISGKTYAFVTPKAGPKTKHLGQYELIYNPATKKVDAKLVRRFGAYSGVKETESVAFDPIGPKVYYSDETVGTHLYDANPSAVEVELNFFNRTGTKGDHEGIAIWPSDKNGNGWVVCTDQIDLNSVYRVFDRKTQAFVGAFSGGADQTDGIDLNVDLGLFAVMNSKDKNFLVYSLADIAKALRLKPKIKPLKID